MTTIILCGGRGIRLNEETAFVPKPLIRVGGKPLVWHIMKIYSHYGFNKFVLALGYKADYIMKNKAEVNDFEVTCVDTGAETSVGERILKCRQYIPEKDAQFMVTYGDGVADLDVRDLAKFHEKQKTLGTITGVRPRSKFGLVDVGEDRLVKKFVEKPILTDWVNGGFMVFDREAFNYFRVGEMEHPALERLVKEQQLSLYQHNGFWYAVDTFKELETLRSLWSSGNPPWKVWG